MSEKFKTKPVLLIDTREKHPPDFSSYDDFSEIKYVKLDSGDFTLEGLEHIVTIERKNSVNELFGNLYKRSNLDRFIRELDRMPPQRFIVVEAEWSDLYDPANFYVNVLAGYRHGNKPNTRRSKGRVIHPDVPRMIVTRRLMEFMIKYNTKIIFAGDHAAEAIKSILLEIANEYPPRLDN